MLRVLITGGSGFVGLAVCKALAKRGDVAIAIDVQISDELSKLSTDNPAVVAGVADIANKANLKRVFEVHKPDAVIHCAAMVGVVASIGDPASLLRVNIDGANNLFEVMPTFGVRRVIHISSEEVYGEFQSDIVTEDHPQNPLYAYGISKAAVEHFGRTYKITHDIECINIRTSWVYGPNFPRKRVPCNLLEAAALGESLHVSCGADSKIDHTYIDDTVSGILGALDCAKHPYDAYHIASSTCPTLAEIVEVIKELVPGADISVGEGTYKHADIIDIPRKGALDCTRASEVFGYKPRFDIRAGLKAYLTHFKQKIKRLGN